MGAERMVEGHGPRAYFLVGPTAAGKTAIAHHLAQHQGHVLVSADSMLVYRGMDIGTAKPSISERGGVVYAGLDCVDPWEPFSVFDWLHCVTPWLAAGATSGATVAAPPGHIPIVVGGTGLYVSALLRGLDPLPASNPERRAHWDRVLADGGIDALRIALAAVGPEHLRGLRDDANPRRLIRALLLAESGVPSAERRWQDPAGPPGPVVGLRLSPDLLHARIRRRVEAMYAAGFLDEVRALRAHGAEWASTALQAIGYREALDHLDGRCGLVDAQEATVRRTRLLAKRQYTWFRRQCDVAWIDVEEGASAERLAQRVWERWAALGPAKVVLPGTAGGEGMRHVQDSGDGEDNQGDADASQAPGGIGSPGG